MNPVLYIPAYTDAAHCHSPAGGQGLNLGLQDGKREKEGEKSKDYLTHNFSIIIQLVILHGNYHLS